MNLTKSARGGVVMTMLRGKGTLDRESSWLCFRLARSLGFAKILGTTFARRPALPRQLQIKVIGVSQKLPDFAGVVDHTEANPHLVDQKSSESGTGTAVSKKDKPNRKRSGNIQDLMETVTYKHGEFICRQGELGDCFFIITSGKVDVRVEMDDAASREAEPELWNEAGKWVASMGGGEIFGERAVLSNNPIRTANCIANGLVRILKMNVTMDTLVKNPEINSFWSVAGSS